MTFPPVRVIVRLPYNRPEHAVDDPAPVVWNIEKENYLWDHITSRGNERGNPDFQALAARLEVPLPYLLYRAQARYEQGLQGLQDFRSAFGPPNTPRVLSKPGDDILSGGDNRLPLPRAEPSRIGARLSNPLGARTRLNSLGHNSAVTRLNRATSSSVLTLRGAHRKESSGLARPSSPLSARSESDEEAEQLEETERVREEQEALQKKIADLQKVMTGDALGLVSSVRTKRKDKEPERGRLASSFHHPTLDLRQKNRPETLSRSQSISSSSSPHGSIPSIPSPPPDAHSPMGQRFSPGGRTNGLPPTSPAMRPQMRFEGLVKQGRASERGSNYSSASLSSYGELSGGCSRHFSSIRSLMPLFA
ncbi:hypothetical protein OF83DRAFT_410739 [Amylostereum chailletii]|nr:hypothetical protein OF83DRAFT_410739 [Amylostereum chailletii]